MITWVSGQDPGEAHTGLVLSRVMSPRDQLGAPDLEPVDGLTVDRRNEHTQACERLTADRKTVRADDLRLADLLATDPRCESPDHRGGQLAYASRVASATLAMHDSHGATDETTLVCIEDLNASKAEDTGMVFKRISTGTMRCGITLGKLAGTWPDAMIVSPAGKWPNQKRTGWDGDPEPRPGSLLGRRPRDWTPGGGSARSHQASAYSMSRAGWRLYWQRANTVAELVGAAKHQSALALVAVARQVWPGCTDEQMITLALEAAVILRPSTSAPERLTALRQGMTGLVSDAYNGVELVTA